MSPVQASRLSMCVDVVSYIDPSWSRGGGELIVRALLEAGGKRGHRFRQTHRYPHAVVSEHPQADLTLAIDVWNLPGHWGRADRRLQQRAQPGASAQRYEDRVQRMTAAERFVHHDNAYVDVCARAYLPCNGALDCGLSRRGRPCSRLRHRWSTLYTNAAASSFLSPLHRQVIRSMIGGDAKRDLILRPLIDPELFRDLRNDRDLERLYVGPLHEAKGLENMKARFSPDEVWTVSPTRRWRERIRRPRRERWGESLPVRGHQQMADLYNRTETLVLLPRWPEPQGRVVIEAALCGCRLDTNDRVGALSFGVAPNDPDLCRGSADEWWASVERLAWES